MAFTYTVLADFMNCALFGIRKILITLKIVKFIVYNCYFFKNYTVGLFEKKNVSLLQGHIDG